MGLRGPKCRPVAERFFGKFKVMPGPNGCWLWQGDHSEFGYGRISSGGHKGRQVLAHRLSWEIHRGTIPAGLGVLHNCPTGDNPSCVNPEHLWLGTQAENNRDCWKKGRMGSQRKMICVRGHVLDPATTYRHRGHRICRQCRRTRVRQYRARLADALVGIEDGKVVS